MNYVDIKTLLGKIKKTSPKILVLGDVMLDQYINGEVKRISPEAPVPVLNFKKKKEVLGGAGNVVHNLVNLGAEVSIGTIIGQDYNGELVMNLFKSLNALTDSIIKVSNINTTKKTRFLSEGAQLLRLDNDSKGLLDKNFKLFKEKIIKIIDQFDCIIISDYDKGVCEEKVVQEVINKANKKNIPIFIDPKGQNWNKYMNATCITPNTKEVEKQLNLRLKDDLDFENAAKLIKKKLQLKSCLITRGSDGMTYYEENKIIHQKVAKKEVFDVSGAGDTVISCFSVSFSSGLRISDSIELSSIIASEVIMHIGTTPFNIKFLKNKNIN